MNPMSPYSRQLQAMADEAPPAPPGSALPASAPPVQAARAEARAERVEHEPIEMRRAALTTPRAPGVPLSPIAAVLAWLPAAAADTLVHEAAADVRAGGGAGPAGTTGSEPGGLLVDQRLDQRLDPRLDPAADPAADPVAERPAAVPGAPSAGWRPQPALGYVPSQRTRGTGVPARPSPAPSRWAVVALVAALLGLGPVAVVLGHRTLRDVRRSARRTRQVALAALVLGYAGTVAALVLVAALAGVPFAVGLVPSGLAGLLGLG